MKNLLAIRAQAALCRQLAIREPAKRVHWLGSVENQDSPLGLGVIQAFDG